MANLNIRIDDNLKKQAQELFKDIGLDMTTAITMFLQQAVTDNCIPFEVRRYNAETIEALERGKELRENPELLKNYKLYNNFQEFLNEVLEEMREEGEDV